MTNLKVLLEHFFLFALRPQGRDSYVREAFGVYDDLGILHTTEVLERLKGD